MLILGGTAEARALATALGQRATLSLAGVTAASLPVPGHQREGGFGGAEGLARYLTTEGFGMLIDVTHPFAIQISRNAIAAAEATGIPLLRLNRPAWPVDPSWHRVPDLTTAAEVLPAGARVFLSVGSRSLTPFYSRNDLWFLTRCIEPPAKTPHGEVLLQRPPFTLTSEIALFEAHQITHLVSKNAGGGSRVAKLEAAKRLGIKTIMVDRPQLPPAFEVASVAEAFNWVADKGETI